MGPLCRLEKKHDYAVVHIFVKCASIDNLKGVEPMDEAEGQMSSSHDMHYLIIGHHTEMPNA